MAQCLLLHGWLVLLKTGACCGLPIFFEVTTNWRAGCQKLACPVRREGRTEVSSLPPSSGLDLIPYVEGHGRPPDRSDELIAGGFRWRGNSRVCKTIEFLISPMRN